MAPSRIIPHSHNVASLERTRIDERVEQDGDSYKALELFKSRQWCSGKLIAGDNGDLAGGEVALARVPCMSPEGFPELRSSPSQPRKSCRVHEGAQCGQAGEDICEDFCRGNGRAGLLEEAFEMVISMEIPANIVVWGTLLAACRVHSDVEMAERLMERILLLGEIGDTNHYVIMSNMYRLAGRLTEMAMVRREVGRKPTGRSWIEIDGLVSKFGVGADADAYSHPNWSEIQTMLDAVDVKLGVEMRDGVYSENPHRERLAPAFGLIKSCGSAPIRISKNLWICEKCHEWMKLVSRVYEREIIVRDCIRFHRFTGGLCSCKDYW